MEFNTFISPKSFDLGDIFVTIDLEVIQMSRIDPEVKDNDEEGVGDPDAYDNEAVSSTSYDHSQFELPDGGEDAR